MKLKVFGQKKRLSSFSILVRPNSAILTSQIMYITPAAHPEIPGCRIFLGTLYKNAPNLQKNVPNGHKISQMSMKYSNKFLILGPPKFTQIMIFWFENKPSDTPL
jgi:hypothetical protein